MQPVVCNDRTRFDKFQSDVHRLRISDFFLHPTDRQTETKFGTFHLIFKAFIQSLDELSNLPEVRQGESSYDKVEVEYSGVTYLGPNTSTDDGGKIWAYNQGFFESMLGQLKSSKYNSVNSIGEGTRRSETFSAESSDGRRARITVTSEVLKNQWWTVNMGINRKWAVGGASFKLESYNADDSEAGDIEMSKFVPATTIEVDIDAQKYTPESVMLLKVFIACDGYFINLYKAKKNGELIEKECQTLRAELVSQLINFLKEINKICIAFHKVRKKAEAQL